METGDFSVVCVMIFELEGIINHFLFAAAQNFVMQVRGECPSRVTRFAYFLSLANMMSAFDGYPVQVEV